MTTMTDAAARKALENLRDADTHRIHIAATGAGAGLQALLWSVPGCSSLLSGASFPYAQDETDAFLGHSPGRYASAEAAIDLAIGAYHRARRATQPAKVPVGIGIAASVASLGAHRGEHRIHVAALAPGCAIVTSVVLTKGAGQEARDDDGVTADLLGLMELLAASGAGEMGDATKATILRRAQSTTRLLGSEADSLFSYVLDAFPLVLADGTRRPSTDLLDAARARRLLVHPGTFNPPHAGHIEGARTALDVFSAEACGRIRLGRPGAPSIRLVHSITLDPPNKPALSTTEALDRAVVLGKLGADVILGRGDPLFVDKAERMPGAAFVVGADTVLRMLDPCWGLAPVQVLDRLMRAGARLYVVGRLVPTAAGTEQFVDVNHQRIADRIPSDLRFMFKHVPGRWDVSSSELRALKAATQDNCVK
jgi:hypothetical protein